MHKTYDARGPSCIEELGEQKMKGEERAPAFRVSGNGDPSCDITIVIALRRAKRPMDRRVFI